MEQAVRAPERGLIGPGGEGLVIIAEQIAEFGGVERILATLLARFPAARLVASRFRPAAGFSEADFHARVGEHAGERQAAGSPKIRLVGSPERPRRHFLFPLYARELRAAPVGDAGAVLALGGHGWANAVPIPAGARHVAYAGGPPRMLYGHGREYRREYPAHVRPLLHAATPALRAHHRRLLSIPQAVAANSRCSADGIERILGRPVEVIYPPVRTEFFTPDARERTHFLVVSRLRLHKRVGVVIEAFRRLGLPLVVAGEGIGRDRLVRDTPPNVRFVGHVGDEELRELYRSSRALVSASVEEFGISLVEGLAAGVPLIAPRAGGSGEIVADGVNGFALDTVDPGSVVDAVARLEREPIDPTACRRSADRFSEARFAAEVTRLLEGA